MDTKITGLETISDEDFKSRLLEAIRTNNFQMAVSFFTITCPGIKNRLAELSPTRHPKALRILANFLGLVGPIEKKRQMTYDEWSAWRYELDEQDIPSCGGQNWDCNICNPVIDKERVYVQIPKLFHDIPENIIENWIIKNKC